MCGWLFPWSYSNKQFLQDVAVLVSFLVEKEIYLLSCSEETQQSLKKIFWKGGASSCCCLVQGLRLFSGKVSLSKKKKKRNKSHLLMKFRLRKFSWNDPWYSKQTSCFYLVTQLNFHPRLKSICALRNKDLLKISGQRCPWHAYVPRPARSGRS